MLSLGSNKALEFLRGGSIDFGSTAGSAAIVARAGGVPIRRSTSIRARATASLPARTAAFERVEDLKGKSVAVTPGTYPHIFLLRAVIRKVSLRTT